MQCNVDFFQEGFFALLTLTPELKIQCINRETQTLLGVEDVSGFVGKEILTLFDPKDHTRLSSYFMHSLLQPQSQGIETLLICNDTIPLPVRVHAYLNDERSLLQLIIHDIREEVSNRKLLELTFDSISDLVVLTYQGKVMEHCSHSVLDFFGSESIDAFKEKFGCICNCFLPDSEKGYMGKCVGDQSWIEYASEHRPHAKVCMRDFSGEERVFCLHTNQISEHRYTVFFSEITRMEVRQNRMQAMLDTQKDDYFYLVKMFDAAEKIGDFGVIQHEMQNRIQTWSKGIYRLIDDTDESIEPSWENLLNLISEKDRAWVEDIANQAMDESHGFEIECDLETRQHQWKRIKAEGKMTESANRTRRFVIFCHDISDEYTLRKSKHEREQMLHQQQKHKAIMDLFRNLSHHWRQPLSSISLISGSLEWHMSEQGVMDEKLQADFNMLKKELDFLSETIDTFSKHTQKDLNYTTFTLYSVIDMLMQSEKKQQVAHPAFHWDLVQKNVIIKGVAEDLTQLLKAIIENAKESLQKRAKNDSFSPVIHISTHCTPEEVAIHIRDNGLGITDDVVGKIFEPYFTTKFKSRGTGLSLSLVKMITEDVFSGSIRVNNKVEEGVEFILTLPALCKD